MQFFSSKYHFRGVVPQYTASRTLRIRIFGKHDNQMAGYYDILYIDKKDISQRQSEQPLEALVN